EPALPPVAEMSKLPLAVPIVISPLVTLVAVIEMPPPLPVPVPLADKVTTTGGGVVFDAGATNTNRCADREMPPALALILLRLVKLMPPVPLLDTLIDPNEQQKVMPLVPVGPASAVMMPVVPLVFVVASVVEPMLNGAVPLDVMDMSPPLPLPSPLALRA